MKWLSRGLYEALIAFIGQAKNEDYALRAALYEFRYEPVGRAFKDALRKCRDVQILYDKPNYGKENADMARKLGLAKICKARSVGGAQKHNKFIVLLKNGKPVEVWTGSTNISAGGIFGHSNVGHSIQDANIAAQYLREWEALATDPPGDELRDLNLEMAKTPAKLPPAGTTVLFSPRDKGTLEWYGSIASQAKEMLCLTVAFTLNSTFEPALKADNDVLRYLLSDKSLDKQRALFRDGDVTIASGATFEQGDVTSFLAEKLTGLNRNYYIHTKFMLIDPLTDDPTVITGSANFSLGSQTTNDENMLIIRSDTRVADVYLGEFMRIFDHLYARMIARRARSKKSTDKKRNFLHTNDRWVAAHFGQGAKSRRREVFLGS
jgi:phosphatidylserine/phosphatidylglycerophosphate/cardiolipin synthase-like enzyme